MARIPEILTAAAILLPGCASADTPRPTNGPVVQEVIATATAIPCVPKEFAERMGVPTPVSIGGGAASAEIVRLTDRLYRCDETLSDVEKEALRALNANNPLLATPDPAKQIVPQPTNTPESLRFANFGIYKGPIDGGGEVLLAAKPDGRMAAAVKRTDIACSNANIKPLTYLIDFPREDASFAYKAENASGVVSKSIRGELNDGEIIGHLGNDKYPVQSATGSITCPATSFSYRAIFIGLQKDTFIKEYKQMWPEPTNPQLEAIFDRFLGK